MNSCSSNAIYRIQLNGSDSEFTCRKDSSLLAAATGAGIKAIAIGCRAGGCGVCKIRVLTGHFQKKVMSRAQLTESEEQSGYTLACRVYPQSDMLIEICQTSKMIIQVNNKQED